MKTRKSIRFRMYQNNIISFWHICTHASRTPHRKSTDVWLEVSSFVMVVYDKIIWKFSQSFLSKARLKKFLIDNHYKTIYGSVRSECSSCMVKKSDPPFCSFPLTSVMDSPMSCAAFRSASVIFGVSSASVIFTGPWYPW